MLMPNMSGVFSLSYSKFQLNQPSVVIPTVWSPVGQMIKRQSLFVSEEATKAECIFITLLTFIEV